MAGPVEGNIRIKAIFIYIIVAAGCSGMIFYIYQLRDTIDVYKNNIEEYHAEIAHVDSLIQFVNNTQHQANQYVLTRRLVHLRQFRKNLNAIEQYLDSVGQQEQEAYHAELLSSINGLLREKGHVISRLNKQFSIQEEPDSISEILSSYEPVVQKDSIVITTVTQDTTFHVPVPQKRNFFQRVFSSAKEAEPDTVFSISTIQSDTLLIINQPDTIPMLSELTSYTEQIRQDYRSRLMNIQQEVNRLLIADQQISRHISGQLLDLYSNTIRNILSKINEQEELIRHTNRISVIAGIVALTLILLFIVLIFHDVNKGIRNRKALEEANSQIQQTMESRHKLLLSVSHDIKTPLNSILGYLELAGKPEFTEKEMDAMKNAGDHILSLLNNLLEFSGLEQGGLKASPVPFNLYEVCSATAAICKPLAKAKGLTFATDFSFDRNLYVLADSMKIKQIILNILSNAIKYTPQGDILYYAGYEDNKIIISIKDTGVGLSPEQIQWIYQPFTRMENHTSLAEGSGIGMYVVKGLTELLDGDIDIVSQPNRGTEITITLPAEETIGKEQDDETAKQILLVDDDPSFLLLLKELVTSLGHQAETCAPEGFEQKKRGLSGYDLILTDMEMGDITGIDILQQSRDTGFTNPVIIMTGRTDFNYAEASRSGFSNYVAKPVTKASLKSIIGDVTLHSESGNKGPDGLENLFGDNPEAIREIIETFIDATLINIGNLQEAIEEEDFYRAQQTGHKMLPMFIQMNGGEAAEILKRIDSWRNDTPEDHPEWKTEVEKLIVETGKLLTAL